MTPDEILLDRINKRLSLANFGPFDDLEEARKHVSQTWLHNMLLEDVWRILIEHSEWPK